MIAAGTYELTEAVQIQLIIVFGSIACAIVAAVGAIILALVNRTRQHAKAASDNTAATRTQVTNDHKTNLRDDLDDKFKAMGDDLATVLADLGTVKTTQAKQGKQISALFSRDNALAKEIEDTKRPQSKPRSYAPPRRKTK